MEETTEETPINDICSDDDDAYDEVIGPLDRDETVRLAFETLMTLSEDDFTELVVFIAEKRDIETETVEALGGYTSE